MNVPLRLNLFFNASLVHYGTDYGTELCKTLKDLGGKRLELLTPSV